MFKKNYSSTMYYQKIFLALKLKSEYLKIMHVLYLHIFKAVCRHCAGYKSSHMTCFTSWQQCTLSELSAMWLWRYLFSERTSFFPLFHCFSVDLIWSLNLCWIWGKITFQTCKRVAKSLFRQTRTRWLMVSADSVDNHIH